MAFPGLAETIQNEQGAKQQGNYHRLVGSCQKDTGPNLKEFLLSMAYNWIT
jgi:hypothetical protein